LTQVARALRVRDMLEHASGWGTLVILLGISIEIWAFFGLGDHDPRERLVTLVANSFIAAGLLIEYAAVRLSNAASGKARAEAAQEVADAHERAAAAEQRAAEAILSLQQSRAPRLVMMEAANGREVIKSRRSGRRLPKLGMA